jgi:hypothetical protein
VAAVAVVARVNGKVVPAAVVLPAVAVAVAAAIKPVPI